MKIELDNKVVLITGAGSGIGKCAARMFAECGASVIVHYRDHKEEVDSFLSELSAFPGRHASFQAELLNRDEIGEMFAQVEASYGRLDVLVNNAGYCPKESFLDIEYESLDKTLDINFKAPFICAREAARIMTRAGGGKILFVASVDGDRPGYARSHYAGAKAAEIQFAKNIALELAEHNIHVNVVSPGAIDTKMTAAISQDPDKYARVIQGIPLRRFGEPEEIASMLAFLASSHSGYTTGANFTVDGGLSLMRGY